MLVGVFSVFSFAFHANVRNEKILNIEQYVIRLTPTNFSFSMRTAQSQGFSIYVFLFILFYRGPITQNTIFPFLTSSRLLHYYYIIDKIIEKLAIEKLQSIQLSKVKLILDISNCEVNDRKILRNFLNINEMEN